MKIGTLIITTFIITAIILAFTGTYLSHLDDVKLLENEVYAQLEIVADSHVDNIEFFVKNSLTFQFRASA